MSDYISREAALSFPFANGKYDREHADEHFICGCESYKEWLKTIPAADVVEVRHGKFEGRVFNTVWRIQSCSECREYVPQGDYCSNCGAKMDGGVSDAAD